MTQLMEPRTLRRHRHHPRLRSVPPPDRAAKADRARTLEDVESTRAPVPRWRRVVPTLAISAMAVAYVYAVVPFTFADAIVCNQNGLTGTATVASGTPAGTIIGDMGQRCAEAGSSRTAIAATIAGVALVVGLAGAFAPTEAEIRTRKGGGGPGGGDELPEDYWPATFDRPDADTTVGALSVEELAEILGGLPVDFPDAAALENPPTTATEDGEVDPVPSPTDSAGPTSSRY